MLIYNTLPLGARATAVPTERKNEGRRGEVQNPIRILRLANTQVLAYCTADGPWSSVIFV